MGTDRLVDSYYADVKNVTLLNPERERTLFKAYRTCRKCSHEYTEGALQKACPGCGTARNFRAREQIVEGALRFVVKVARDYARRAKGERHGEELLLALISAGNLGLLVAVDRFELARGTRFLTYAAWWVREKILEELDNMGVVRVPAYQQKAQRARWKQAGSGELEAPYVTLEPLTELDREAGDARTEASLINQYGVTAVTRAMRELRLCARDQYIVLLYFGSREEPKNLRQIAARVGLSAERVRQLKRNAMSALRGALEDEQVTGVSDVFVDR
jgi:RNA polymerase sigma factor (sigma-70 family)